jgi:hypothetical protein
MSETLIACDKCGRGIDGEQYCGDCVAEMVAELERRREHFGMVGLLLDPIREKRSTGEPARSDREELQALIAKASKVDALNEECQDYEDRIADDDQAYCELQEKLEDPGRALDLLRGRASSMGECITCGMIVYSDAAEDQLNEHEDDCPIGRLEAEIVRLTGCKFSDRNYNAMKSKLAAVRQWRVERGNDPEHRAKRPCLCRWCKLDEILDGSKLFVGEVE